MVSCYKSISTKFAPFTNDLSCALLCENCAPSDLCGPNGPLVNKKKVQVG